VDDHPENLLALESILGDLGQNLIKATSGREALRCLLSGEFAVILLDVQMPGMDGFETASLIRERDRLQHTPIIFLTANDKSDLNVFKGYSVGAVDYILKPFAPEVLRAKVNVFIELYRKTEEIRDQAEQLRTANRELGKTNKLLGALYKELELKNEELHEERDFTSAILETAGSFILVLDHDGKITRFNRECERITGYSFAEVRGKYVWEVLAVPEEIEDAKRRVRTGDYPTDAEGLWQTKDGEKRTVAWSNTALRNEDGSVSHFICTGIDITARKQAEERIKQFNEDLERRVEERTLQLQNANRALEQAKESAEAANRSKDQFLAVLSHELRTPLNPVLAAVQALEEEPDFSPEVRHMLKIIGRNVELEARLIDDLLDLTRIAQGKLRLNIDAVDVHSLLGSVIEICTPDIHNKNLQIVLDLQSTRYHVMGDSARLQQVFWNLIKNSIKFTPTGGRIMIRSANVDSRIQIEISDTGIGIDEELLPRIFDAFEQGGQHVTRTFGGLGLGLAISRTLVDVHGGTISAASPGSGHGATFSVELETCDGEPERSNGQDDAEENTADNLGVRILIVEDNTDTNRLMQYLLERQGFGVQTAHSIQSALEAAGAHDFDLVISDIGLPDGSGIDLIRTLRMKSAIKGIAVSGYGMEDDIRRSMEAGFSEHLTKPINFRQLKAAIRKIVPAR
jgi:PAS domain S-box-containing protein